VGLFQQAAAAPRGKLKVDVPGRFGRLVIAPALPTFFARFPDIEIELGVTDRAVDVIQDGIDCAIRVGAPEDSGLIARKLGELPLVNCASPAYLAAYGTPRTAADLDAHIAVNYASPTSGRLAPWAWTEGGQARSRTMAGKVTVNSAEAYIACCLAGLGLIQVPAYDVRDYLGSGGLVEVMPGERAAPMPLTLLYPHRGHLSRRLQAFVDWVVTLLESSVLQVSPGGGRRTHGGATP
jgi:DNA-binding transcriptional LysR family regulator